MLVKISFAQEPKKALAYLKNKGYQPTFHYDEMMHEAHHKAFTVAKIAQIDLLKDIHQSLIQAQKNGIPFSQWKKNIKPTLQKKGWWGEVEAVDPKTGEVKSIYVGSRRLKTIYGTNIRVSYAVGRQKQQRALKLAVYWRYVAILDSKTRDKHRDMHGIVKHRDDIWWKTNYPPNGWNCRCKVQAYTQKQLDKQGFKEHKGALENIADKDWAYDVGQSNIPTKLYHDKRQALPSSLQDASKKEAETLYGIEAIKKLFALKKKDSAIQIGSVEELPLYFSTYTRDKQLQHHPELLEIEYDYVPIMIAQADEIINNGKYRYFVKKFGDKIYFVVVKKAKGRKELFLQSFRITKEKELKRLRG